MILAIDPGETVGIAWISFEGQTYDIQELPVDEFFEWLARQVDPERPYFVGPIVIEDYRLLRGKQMQQTGSTFPAVQVIGAARLAARVSGVELVTQSPQILRLTEMHMHWPVHAPTSHVPDYLSAQLHALHYMETQGISTARLRELNPVILKP